MPYRLRIVSLVVMLGALAVSVGNAQTVSIDKSYYGTWKLNLAKSKYENVTPAKESVRTHEDRGGGFTLITTDAVNAQGAKTRSAYLYKPDGKEYPVAAANQTGFATISLIVVDPYSVTFTQKLDGKVTSTGTRVVSKDGKTMTIATKGTNAKGQATSTNAFYDKQ